MILFLINFSIRAKTMLNLLLGWWISSLLALNSCLRQILSRITNINFHLLHCLFIKAKEMNFNQKFKHKFMMKWLRNKKKTRKNKGRLRYQSKESQIKRVLSILRSRWLFMIKRCAILKNFCSWWTLSTRNLIS